MAASTITHEQGRKDKRQYAGLIHQTVQQKLGTITEVHPEVPMIKAVYTSGTQAAGNDWIPIGHSVLDIVHRFGVLRPGLRVLITFTSEAEKGAIATVVGVEGEKLGDEIQEPNTMTTPPYLLFQQGNAF